jgi:hypothetical protein
VGTVIPLGGMAIFYGLGEWLRRRIVATHPKDTNWTVLGVLIVGLTIFFVGGYFFLLLPTLVPGAALLMYGIVSALIGFAASYFFVKERKNTRNCLRECSPRWLRRFLLFQAPRHGRIITLVTEQACEKFSGSKQG